MSGLHVPLLGHVVRRGVEVVQSQFTVSNKEYMAQLEHDAELYDQSGPEMEVKPQHFLIMVITGLVAMLIIASVRYTVGEVIASLTMIESSTSTAIIEDKPPAYADEPDAPLEKAPFVPSDAEADIEVTLIRHKLVTSKITTSMGHLTAVGGFTARWRGLFLFGLYHTLHSVLTSFISSALLGSSMAGYVLSYIFISLCLARLHMVWTHSVIAYPSAKPWWRRLVSRKQCRVVLLPTLFHALAQQATFILPIAVAFALGLNNFSKEDFVRAADHEQCSSAILKILSFLAVPATAIFVALAVLLPASVTLTRIEAALLPEDQETIVPFDRLAVMGDVDVAARGAPKAIFVQAWRSFDRASRWRLVKLYSKMILIQFTVAVTAFHLILAEIFLIGSERLALVCKSGIAQLQLMALEAEQNAN